MSTHHLWGKWTAGPDTHLARRLANPEPTHNNTTLRVVLYKGRLFTPLLTYRFGNTVVQILYSWVVLNKCIFYSENLHRFFLYLTQFVCLFFFSEKIVCASTWTLQNYCLKITVNPIIFVLPLTSYLNSKIFITFNYCWWGTWRALVPNLKKVS